MKKIIYVVDGDVSVYESQVLSLLVFLSQKTDIDLTLVQGYKNSTEKSRIMKKQEQYSGLNVVWVKSYPMYPFFYSLILSNYRKVLKDMNIKKDTVFHVRSEYMGFILCELRRKMNLDFSVLVDVRGILKEELAYKMKNTSYLKRVLMSFQIKYCNYFYPIIFNKKNRKIIITSVSPAISCYLSANFSLSSNLLYVNPNIVGSQFVYSEIKRKEIRAKYGISDNEWLAVCSTGGGSIWQKDYQVIPELIKRGIRVINLANKDWGLEKCITTIVPFQEMPEMLSAADIAVLWRDDTFMNNSASPSKFSEFSAMGLFVIHNGSVRIANDYIRETGAGAIIDNISDIENIDFTVISSDNRKKWILNGRNIFGVENITKNYIRLYNKLLQ